VQALLYANLTTRTLSESPGGAPFSWPDLIEGDTLRIALRFLKTLGDGQIEIDPPVRRVLACLEPISFLRSRSHLVDGRRVHELRLAQSPVAFADSSARAAPPAPEIATVQDGGSEGEIVWNEIQSLRVPPQFRGIYRLRRPGSFARSR